MLCFVGRHDICVCVVLVLRDILNSQFSFSHLFSFAWELYYGLKDGGRDNHDRRNLREYQKNETSCNSARSHDPTLADRINKVLDYFF